MVIIYLPVEKLKFITTMNRPTRDCDTNTKTNIRVYQSLNVQDILFIRKFYYIVAWVVDAEPSQFRL